MSTFDIYNLIEEGKIKRYFRVAKKLIVENGVYHVMQRAPGKEKMFVEESDYLMFLKYLKEIQDKFKQDIFAFVLLPNHFHLLLKIKEKNLPKAMQSLLSRYAQIYNKKYNRKGHVVGGRYRAVLCNDDIYLLTISIYIHLNPFRAGLCKTIEGYKWYSLLPYINIFKKDTFINYQFVLKLLDSNLSVARKIYKHLLCANTDVPYPNIIESPDSIENFLSKITSSLTDIKSNLVTHITKLDRILKDLDGKKYINSYRDKKARKYLIEQLISRGFKIKEICKILKITRQRLYKIMKSPDK